MKKNTTKTIKVVKKYPNGTSGVTTKPTPPIPARAGYVRTRIGGGQYLYLTPDEHRNLMGFSQDPEGFNMGVRTLIGYQPQSSGRPSAASQQDETAYNTAVTNFNASRQAPVDLNTGAQSKDLGNVQGVLGQKQLSFAATGPKGTTGVDTYQQTYNKPASAFNTPVNVTTKEIGSDYVGNPTTGTGYKKGTKAIKTKKYDMGVQNIAVPPKGGVADVINPTLSLAGAGSSIGGPVGAAFGAAVGLGKGIYDFTQSNKANRQATRYNQQIDEVNKFTTNPQLQQANPELLAKKGVKAITYTTKSGYKAPSPRTKKK